MAVSGGSVHWLIGWRWLEAVWWWLVAVSVADRLVAVSSRCQCTVADRLLVVGGGSGCNESGQVVKLVVGQVVSVQWLIGS